MSGTVIVQDAPAPAGTQAAPAQPTAAAGGTAAATGAPSGAVPNAAVERPSTVWVAGVALLVAGGDSGRGAGVVLLGVALLVVLANVFVRLSLDSEREREEEARNRERGVWPEEP